MRREDHRLLTGTGQFVADSLGDETLFAGFLRSDMASARITRLDLPDTHADVVAIFTADDLDADQVPPIIHDPLPRDDGGPSHNFPLPLLVGQNIRHIGEPVAMVVARSQAALSGALEQISLETEDAAPPEGIAFHRRYGDAGAVATAIQAARHHCDCMVEVPRATAASLEPRGGIARALPDGGLSYIVSTQNPFAMRDQLCSHFGWNPETLRVIAADVGGSFGLKGYMTREDALLCWAANRLGAEIAWLPTRSEAFLSDAQGRGVTGRIALAIDADLKLLALEAALEIDAGAYPGRRAFGLMSNVGGLTGMYDIPEVSVEIIGRLSPKVPLVPFRGNGRPEATYAIERALDQAARQIGCDPVELRQRNLIPAGAMPVTTAFGLTLDCGDFPSVMTAAQRFRGGEDARRADAERRGMLFGAGLANCVESAGGPIREPRPDHARLTIGPGKALTLATGAMSSGQGHETAMSAMVAEALEIGVARIDYINGDTSALAHGRGSGGSAGVTVAGSALRVAIDRVLSEGRTAAAALLGCEAAEITYREGAFHRDHSNESATLEQIAAAQANGRWVIDASFTPPAATFPNGTHLCEVEIDPATGATRVTRYGAIEDIGRVLKPVLVEGQMHGGIAQGLSAGLGEEIVHDEAGQILTGSFMDYRMVRAGDVPMMQVGTVEVPTELNPLGVKGVGEAGTVGATAALASAVSDALARAGVADFQPPAAPCRIWAALRDADHPSAQ